jgi:hypothetical protein
MTNTKRLLAKASVIAGMGVGLTLAAGAAANASTAISVSPSSGLANNQVVTVSGSGLTAGNVYHIGECAAVSSTSYACGSNNADVTANSSGSLSTSLKVLKTFTGTAADGSTAAIDCSKVQCVIGVYDSSFGGGSANISFS